MKSPKAALIIIPVVLLISVIIYFVPPVSVLKHIPVIKSLYKNTTLEITTPNGIANVEINNTEYGETPSSVVDLVEGEYSVTLTKKSENTNFYKPQTFSVRLTKNTTSRINIDLGPEDYIYGSILYYTQDIMDKNKGQLTITSNTDSSKIYLDKEFLKSTPITNLQLNPGEYNIKISADNYTDLELPIVIREGLTLNIKAYLLPIPVTFETAQTDE